MEHGEVNKPLSTEERFAAHELRTPIAILKGFAQTLLVQTACGKGPVMAD